MVFCIEVLHSLKVQERICRLLNVSSISSSLSLEGCCSPLCDGESSSDVAKDSCTRYHEELERKEHRYDSECKNDLKNSWDDVEGGVS